MTIRRVAVLCGLASLLTLLATMPALAARLLKATVLQDGKVLLQTYYQDGGRENAASVWQYLGKKPIMVEDQPLVGAEDADPLQARLTGTVVLRFEHAGQVLASAEVTDLRLVRSDPSSTNWFLPPEEVARTAQAA